MDISQPANVDISEPVSGSNVIDTIMGISGPDGSGDADIHEQISVAVPTIAMNNQECKHVIYNI